MKPKVCAYTVPRLIKALIEKPRTPRELMNDLDMGYEGVTKFCLSMHKEGLLHIVDWRFDSANYRPVYAFGPGQDVAERWKRTERAILEAFRHDLLSKDAKEVARITGLSPSTIKKDAYVLAQKGYLIRNPVKHNNIPASWRRNPKMAFPDFGASTQPYTAKPYTPQRPKSNIPQQSWFSAIT
jgi:hypothetical protein